MTLEDLSLIKQVQTEILSVCNSKTLYICRHYYHKIVEMLLSNYAYCEGQGQSPESLWSKKSLIQKYLKTYRSLYPQKNLDLFWQENRRSMSRRFSLQMKTQTKNVILPPEVLYDDLLYIDFLCWFMHCSFKRKLPELRVECECILNEHMGSKTLQEHLGSVLANTL